MLYLPVLLIRSLSVKRRDDFRGKNGGLDRSEKVDGSSATLDLLSTTAMRPSSTTPHGSVMLDSDPDDLPTSEEEDLQPNEQVQFPSTVSMTDTTTRAISAMLPVHMGADSDDLPSDDEQEVLTPEWAQPRPLEILLTHPQTAAAQAPNADALLDDLPSDDDEPEHDRARQTRLAGAMTSAAREQSQWPHGSYREGDACNSDDELPPEDDDVYTVSKDAGGMAVVAIALSTNASRSTPVRVPQSVSPQPCMLASGSSSPQVRTTVLAGQTSPPTLEERSFPRAQLQTPPSSILCDTSQFCEALADVKQIKLFFVSQLQSGGMTLSSGIISTLALQPEEPAGGFVVCTVMALYLSLCETLVRAMVTSSSFLPVLLAGALIFGVYYGLFWVFIHSRSTYLMLIALVFICSLLVADLIKSFTITAGFATLMCSAFYVLKAAIAAPMLINAAHLYLRVAEESSRFAML